MATVPFFVISPNTLLSVIGLMHGPDKTVATPAADWQQAIVDVVIPALNEERNITLCLSSIARQTMRPRQIILIDDGSRDNTVSYAKSFCELNEMAITVIERKKPIGKTPTIKRQAREFDSDVEFILDADTVLESDNYIERTVQELYKAVGIASACGTILPLRNKDRSRLADMPVLQFLSAVSGPPIYPSDTSMQLLRRGITNIYRDSLYMFLQRFVYHGQMVFFGTIVNPVGCAVAYRRKYVQDLFDEYEPILGDDLTNSEDIFIGFAMLNKGYRNIQLTDVYARSEEPEAQRLPRQLYLWSSSFLQSCYYFDGLVRSPFKAFKRYRQRRKIESEVGKEIREKRHISEPYRQAFGEEWTRNYGRPIGWVLLMAAAEKIFFPFILLLMILLRLWKPLAITIAAETSASVAILTLIAKGRRFEYFCKALVVIPLRYMSLLFDLVTIGRFSSDLWISRNRKWRK